MKREIVGYIKELVDSTNERTKDMAVSVIKVLCLNEGINYYSNINI